MAEDQKWAANPGDWWKSMGHVGQVLSEVLLLRSLVTSSKLIKTVCEIGFNAGHSAVTLLDGLATNLIEFDLLALPYSNASRRAVELAYPGRIRFKQGMSQLEVPRHAVLVRSGAEPPCDFWFIDGDHMHGLHLDLRAALSVASDGAIIVVDDCLSMHHAVTNAWLSLIDAGHIVNTSNYTQTLAYPVGRKGWCWGTFQRDPTRVAALSQTERDLREARKLRVDPVSAPGWRRLRLAGHVAADARVVG